MSPKLKPLNEQVILITGASSGIGRVTARRAAEQGARVILVARNEEALAGAVHEIMSDGGKAMFVTADVGDEAQLSQAALAGVEKFGRIDTWVNNAGVGMYGRVDQGEVADDRRLFDTNFWGVVNGSRLALRHLRRDGGALINVGSDVADHPIPLQGMFSASKQALVTFSDALRMEIEDAGLPVSVSVIKTAAIDTPHLRHARNYTNREPVHPTPVYSPELVAEQILFAATHPVRELYVGGAGRMLTVLGKAFPRVMDRILENSMRKQLLERPADHSLEGLYESRGGHGEIGDAAVHAWVRRRSVYGAASRQPVATAMLAFSVVALASYVLMRQRQRRWIG
jgi:short-subunit dehydrogenase